MQLQGLLRLWPFVRPYRRRALIALGALLTAAGAMLLVPIAFQRLIDLGFARENEGHITVYFVALFVVALVLATATGTRYYLMTWMGERVSAEMALGCGVILLGTTLASGAVRLRSDPR